MACQLPSITTQIPLAHEGRVCSPGPGLSPTSFVILSPGPWGEVKTGNYAVLAPSVSLTKHLNSSCMWAN